MKVCFVNRAPVLFTVRYSQLEVLGRVSQHCDIDKCCFWGGGGSGKNAQNITFTFKT